MSTRIGGALFIFVVFRFFFFTKFLCYFFFPGKILFKRKSQDYALWLIAVDMKTGLMNSYFHVDLGSRVGQICGKPRLCHFPAG